MQEIDKCKVCLPKTSKGLTFPEILMNLEVDNEYRDVWEIMKHGLQVILVDISKCFCEHVEIKRQCSIQNHIYENNQGETFQVVATQDRSSRDSMGQNFELWAQDQNFTFSY